MDLFEEEESMNWAKITLEEGVDPFVAAMEGLAEGCALMHMEGCVLR